MTIMIIVGCKRCGGELDFFKNHILEEEVEIEVPPCPDCLEEERNIGYAEGLKEGGQ